MSQGPSVIMRVGAALLALLFLSMAPVLVLCGEKWWHKLGALPVVGFALIFILYAITRRSET